jgi:hypothetical protein
MNKIKPQFILFHPIHHITLFKQTPNFYMLNYTKTLLNTIQLHCQLQYQLLTKTNDNTCRYDLHIKNPTNLSDFTFKTYENKLFVHVNTIITFIIADFSLVRIPTYDIQKKNFPIHYWNLVNHSLDRCYSDDELKLLLWHCHYDVNTTNRLVCGLYNLNLLQ